MGRLLGNDNTYLFQQKSFQLSFTVVNAQSIGSVHNPYQGIRLLKVVSPVRSYGLLTANVPDVQFISDPLAMQAVAAQRIFSIPLKVDSLNVEAQCWAYSTDIFVHNLLDNGCFACIVKSPGQK